MGAETLVRSARPLPPTVSVVVPCFNEEAVLPELIRRTGAACREAAGRAYEIVLVNDGSRDGTWALIEEAARRDPLIVGINLSRNFGHQLALTAGLQMARGERVLVLDADLQDPPEALRDMMALMDRGADVVFGQRLTREGETRFKTASATLFYRILSSFAKVEIPADTGDFRLMTRKVLRALLTMNEQHRFVRGMVAWLGFRQVAYPYHRQGRAAGRTNYSLRMMVRLALDAITGFSVSPLRAGLYIGLLCAAAGFLSAGYALASWLLLDAVPGWASTVILVSVFSSMQLLTLGIVGEYVGRIFVEVKRRPHFVIADIASQDGLAAVRPADIMVSDIAMLPAAAARPGAERLDHVPV